MKLLLDTSVWIWALTEPALIGSRAAAAIADPANELWLSPISVWEFLLLAEKNRLEVVGDRFKWLEQANQELPVRFAALNREIAIESRRMELPHDDPADRFIAATAVVYELILVTSDKKLLRARSLQTLASR